RAAAHAAAAEAPGVSLIGDCRIVGFDRDARGATLQAADGTRFTAPLVVAADSRFSTLRRMAGIGARMLDFGRTALVCRMSHEADHGGVAHECFRYGNTLAMLPMNGRHSSAVVTLRSDLVAEWQGLSDADFAGRIQEQLGSRLGAMAVAGARHAYPLVGVYASRFAGPRFALVGDSAVGMHPVTAHGYNFGLYGVEVLAAELARARRLCRDLGEEAPLRAYEREHRRTTLPIYLGTNAIVQLFTDDRGPARLLRGAVLRAAKGMPPLQALIARQLTGAGAR
ncbi:MAG: FAD-dependent monooxygenase, partial [Burkholderiales bacterium]|nr:FAD-dependent monooxygenase [Burkholderiales bacterium]